MIRLHFFSFFIGIFASLIVILFHYFIFAISYFFLDNGTDRFSSLPPELRFVLPLVAAILTGIFLRKFNSQKQEEEESNFQDDSNFLNPITQPEKSLTRQFFGGGVLLAGGFSGGNVGPEMKLSVGITDRLANLFRLDTRHIETMVGCAAAAVFGAAFHAPIAAIVFSLEAVTKSKGFFRIDSIVPIIIAAMTGTLSYDLLLGENLIFDFITTPMNIAQTRTSDLPYFAMLGLILGYSAICFTSVTDVFSSFKNQPFWLLTLVAGIITAVTAYIDPSIMGVGIDLINRVVEGGTTWRILLVILVLKFIASAACAGFGMPVGMIIPLMILGALIASVCFQLLSLVNVGIDAMEGKFVLLGMWAMFAAVYKAPLTGIIGIFELAPSTQIILPSVIVVLIACIIRQLFSVKAHYEY